ncbi:hypothetical protein T01_9454 [Trichinella spiralis]|uniref:Uncharacterized protein n=1 Tax=Trichinella spiralis TaxID=6334 RepID=A0A0V0YWC1_TRISP|nr:hypothetical protein T01_9454 [Trichinella spiralis]
MENKRNISSTRTDAIKLLLYLPKFTMVDAEQRRRSA